MSVEPSYIKPAASSPTALQLPLPAPWAHLPRKWAPARCATRAVQPSGARGDETITTWQPLAPGTVVFLQHAGPRTADTQRDRPVAAAAVRDPISNRTPRALEPPEWEAVCDDTVADADRARQHGAAGVVLECARGGLWHSALSPLMNGGVDPAAHVARLVTLVARLAERGVPLGVSLCVEDVAVGGIHAALAVDWARQLQRAGASLLVARTGGPFSVPRMNPPVPRFVHEEGPALTAAAWLTRAVPGAVVMGAGALWSDSVVEAALGRCLCHGVLSNAA